jgi:succinate-semialdehyde dehydrogenase/glutarate-semialdehyde dehydrogenase
MTSTVAAPTQRTIADILTAVPTGLVIGGRVVPASDGAELDVLDPATGRSLARVASATVEDAAAALDAAAAAAAGWGSTAPRERSAILSRAFELMTSRGEDLARLIVAENGKVLADARGEVSYAAEFLRWYAEEAVRIPGTLQTAPAGANRILVSHKPIGISILVTPWNFPAAMATRKIGPALAAGCAVVLKPASDTPLTALAIAAIFEQAGLPSGVINVLPSRRSGPVVERLVSDSRTRKLSFTGSTEVGITLLQLAARTVVSTSMELGGNAPFIAAAFTDRLTTQMSALRLGPGDSETTQLGPLITATARTEISGLVQGALAEGATLTTGGTVPAGDGFYYPATVLADVPADAVILRAPIFGPVAPIVTFDTEDQAVRLANDTPFGLVSYLYTGDLARGLRVGERLESGMVGLNRGLVSDPGRPVRRHEAKRHRPRRRRRGPAGVPGKPVHGGHLVAGHHHGRSPPAHGTTGSHDRPATAGRGGTLRSLAGAVEQVFQVPHRGSDRGDEVMLVLADLADQPAQRDGAAQYAAGAEHWHAERADADGDVLVGDGVAAVSGPFDVGFQRRRVGERLRGERLVRGSGQVVGDVGQVGEHGPPGRASVQRQRQPGPEHQHPDAAPLRPVDADRFANSGDAQVRGLLGLGRQCLQRYVRTGPLGHAVVGRVGQVQPAQVQIDRAVRQRLGQVNGVQATDQPVRGRSRDADCLAYLRRGHRAVLEQHIDQPPRLRQ